MNRLRRILVAIKDVAAAELPAVDKALQIARATGASVELYHAITTPVLMDIELNEATLRAVEEQRADMFRRGLESIAERAASPGIEIRTEIGWDYPAHDAILRRAARTKADLIVAECHPGRHLAPWSLHLTDWQLVHSSLVPVLLVKSKGRYQRPIVMAAVDPMHIHSKPVLLDREILRAGLKFAQTLGGSLHAMHAYSPIPVTAPPAERLRDINESRWHAQVRTRARMQLDRTAQKAHVSRARQHLVAGHPVEAIPKIAQDRLRSGGHGSGVALRAGARFHRQHRGTGVERASLRRAGRETAPGGATP